MCASHTKSLKDNTETRLSTRKPTPSSDQKKKKRISHRLAEGCIWATPYTHRKRSVYKLHRIVRVCRYGTAVISRGTLVYARMFLYVLLLFHFFSPLESLLSPVSLAASSLTQKLCDKQKRERTRGKGEGRRKLSVVINSPQRRLACMCVRACVRKSSSRVGGGREGR